MPRPDPLPGSNRGNFTLGPIRVAIKRWRRRPGKKPEDGGVPVEPNRPNTLSGGAAAALEFDD